MNAKKFADFMLSRGYKVSGSTAFGIEGEYPVAISLSSMSQLTIAISAQVDDWKPVASAIKEEKLKISPNYSDNRINFLMVAKDKTFEQQLNDMMYRLTSILSRMNIHPPRECPICGNPGCDSLASYSGGYAPVHKGCLTEVISTVKEKAEENVERGSYALGVLGAFIGAIVGSIPSVLTILWAETIYAVLFALIPLAAYQGYKMLGGKMTKVVIPVTILFSILGVYIIQIILAGWFLMSEYNMPIDLTVQLLTTLLSDGEFWGEMTADSISSFAFVALGIYIAWNRISQTAIGQLKNAESVMDTVVDYRSSTYADTAAPVQAVSGTNTYNSAVDNNPVDL